VRRRFPGRAGRDQALLRGARQPGERADRVATPFPRPRESSPVGGCFSRSCARQQHCSPRPTLNVPTPYQSTPRASARHRANVMPLVGHGGRAHLRSANHL
jgi:hypothetical protein